MAVEELAPSLEEQRERVRQWLQEGGYTVKDVPLQQDRPSWVLFVENGTFQYAVSQSQERPAITTVYAEVLLEEHAHQLGEAGEGPIQQLRMGLLAFDLDTISVGSPLRRVTFSVEIPTDEASRVLLYQAVRKLRNAIYFVFLTLGPLIGGADSFSALTTTH